MNGGVTGPSGLTVTPLLPNSNDHAPVRVREDYFLSHPKIVLEVNLRYVIAMVSYSVGLFLSFGY